MVIRRLEGIFYSDNEGTRQGASARGYDYYMSLYKDFMNLAVMGMDELDATAPGRMDDEFETMTARLVPDALRRQLPELEKEFAIFE
ncbi:MAG TPA: hypothetical protein GX525_05920 [Bacilli bacterium]|nr:hypothetical protein [Bacilli bacterium]